MNPRRGLSLLEVVVASAILVTLSAAMAQLLTVMIRTRASIVSADRSDFCRSRCMNVLTAAGQGWDGASFDACFERCKR